jgi:hypothetical protein
VRVLQYDLNRWEGAMNHSDLGAYLPLTLAWYHCQRPLRVFGSSFATVKLNLSVGPECFCPFRPQDDTSNDVSSVPQSLPFLDSGHVGASLLPSVSVQLATGFVPLLCKPKSLYLPPLVGATGRPCL